MSGGEEKFQGRKRRCWEMRRGFEGEGGGRNISGF